MPKTTTAASAESDQDWEMIRRSLLFGRLPEPVARELVSGRPILALEKNAALCRQGEPATQCFIVVEGLVKQMREGEDGESAVLGVHGAGRALMIAEGLTGRPYSASVRAVGPSRVLSIDSATLRTRIESDGRLAMTLLASASAHLRVLVAHIAELKTLTGPARLAHLVVELAGVRSGQAEVTLPYEKQLIANHLGLTPESLSRAMGHLKRHGVTVARDRLVIRDVARLRAAVTQIG